MTLPSDPSFLPIGVYPSESPPAALLAMGINFYTPARDNQAGTWCPSAAQQAEVSAVPGFYWGGPFYSSQWTQTAFNVFGDELDGTGVNGLFDCCPAGIRSVAVDGSFGGLTGASFIACINQSKTLDPTLPTYIQVTGNIIDGGNDWHYTVAQKQAICQQADILSFDRYPIVLLGGSAYNQYDYVAEAVSYAGNTPVWPFIEMDIMPGSSRHPSPAQTVAEVWNAIAAGARGIQYFDYYGTITNQRYAGGGKYPAGAMYQAIKTTNAQLTQLAPVINGTTWVVGVSGGKVRAKCRSKMDGTGMTVFACSNSHQPQTVKFTLAQSFTTCTELLSGRVIPIASSTWSDSFPTATTVAVYQLT